jgi:hypothetical protein
VTDIQLRYDFNNFRIVLSDPLNLNNRINNNLRTHFGQSRDILHEDNQIPDKENISSLVDSIRRNQEEILCLRVKNEQFVKQLEEIKTRMQQVQNLTKIDVSMTLEEINTGLIKRIRRKVIHIPPGCLGGLRRSSCITLYLIDLSFF